MLNFAETATLVLLLGVSGAIVVRSYVLRRRHQALVEEAIRNGTWVPPTFNAGGRRGRRDVGEKPTMWDAWVGKDREVVDADGGKGAGVGGWSDLLVRATHSHLLLTCLYKLPTAYIGDVFEPATLHHTNHLC